MKPAYKSPEIQKFNDELMGVDIRSSIHNDTCVSCSQPAKDFKDQTSIKEFAISGLCQKCQDLVFDFDEEVKPFKVGDKEFDLSKPMSQDEVDELVAALIGEKKNVD